MQTPAQISFHGLDPSPTLRALIEQRIEDLERYCDHIVTVRVTVELPGKRHHQGNRFHVRVLVAVPGEDVVVDHDPDLDKRHEDAMVAVRDAFDQARRRIQDYVRLHPSRSRVGPPDRFAEGPTEEEPA